MPASIPPKIIKHASSDDLKELTALVAQQLATAQARVDEVCVDVLAVSLERLRRTLGPVAPKGAARAHYCTTAHDNGIFLDNYPTFFDADGYPLPSDDAVTALDAEFDDAGVLENFMVDLSLAAGTGSTLDVYLLPRANETYSTEVEAPRSPSSITAADLATSIRKSVLEGGDTIASSIKAINRDFVVLVEFECRGDRGPNWNESRAFGHGLPVATRQLIVEHINAGSPAPVPHD